MKYKIILNIWADTGFQKAGQIYEGIHGPELARLGCLEEISESQESAPVELSDSEVSASSSKKRGRPPKEV